MREAPTQEVLRAGPDALLTKGVLFDMANHKNLQCYHTVRALVARKVRNGEPYRVETYVSEYARPYGSSIEEYINRLRKLRAYKQDEEMPF